MTSLTFYGGVDEIGGNKILLTDQDTRIFLDFGMGFGSRGKFFEEFLTPRTANGIGDFLATGLLPDIKGVYRSDLLTHYGRPQEEPDIDAVFLSHAHADHSNYISFLHGDIPVYCGKTAKLILEAVEEQSKRNIENEVLNFRRRPLFRCDYRKPPTKRVFKTFRTGDKLRVGGLEIEPVHVDHSVPGAYGFIIHTSEGAVVYTGDLRLHGNNPQMTSDFVDKARESKPVAMITEGTRIDIKEDKSTEQTVYNTARDVVSNAGGLVVADFNFKDVDRFRTFYRIARESGRKFVISFKHACFLERYALDKNLSVPHIDDEHIMLFKPKLGTGTYLDDDYSNYRFIKNRLHYENIVTADELRENQGAYMIVLNFWYFNNFVDLKPEDGTYIHSLSEPFNEEMEISFGRMNNWLNHFNLKSHQAHCSGHAPRSELIKIIEEVNPKKLYPIHTEHPKMFKEFFSNVTVVEKDEGYEI
jgi:ribonuclease J